MQKPTPGSGLPRLTPDMRFEVSTGGKIHYVQRHALQQWILRERHERKGPAGFLFSQRPTLESRPHLSTLRHEFFKVGRACAG